MAVLASESASTSLTLLLFGPMHVLVHNQPLPHLRSRKALWLLALLALRHGRPVERDWLAGTLWPDTDPSGASNNLRANLSELRRALGDQKERLLSPSRHTLSLNLTGAEVDLATFDAAILSKHPEALKQAVALYRGPLLEDCAEEWVAQERRVREQNCLDALQILADAALAVGDLAVAIRYYQRAVGLDPWSDMARRGWMEALAKSGDRNAAMQVYREYVELLRSDPHAIPDLETSALYTHLRAEARHQSRTQTTVPAKEPIGQVAAPQTTSGYLPNPLTDLIGRVEERIEVTAKLRGSRLVTLLGPGGIGKTRLAIEVARESVQDGAAYPDGVWFVALETLSEGRLVVTQVASVLGLPEEPGHSLLQTLTDYLRTKRLLLVLDNCEHLLEACAQVAGRLLQECARMRILATSREPFGITGETSWLVPSLTTPDPRHFREGDASLLPVLRAYESVQLFVERAQARQKGFALMASNAMATAQVCSRLEGIPLAIELAAARVKSMTVEQIAMRLDDHLSLLTVGNRAAQSRQQTLRATLDWSYALLSKAEGLLLGRASVFAGGWTLGAAEGVCSGEDIKAWHVLDLLTSLVDKSLVVFEERGRYHLLETVRQYAVEHLQTSGAAEQVKSRHWHWCVALAEEADTHLMGADQGTWLHRVETEYANMRAALIWSGTDGQEAPVKLRLAGVLWRYWQMRSYYSEGRQFLEAALTGEEAPVATQARAKALQGTGALALSQSDYVTAQTLLEESLRISRQLGDKQGIALATGNLGFITGNQGDLAAAKTQFEESLRLHRELAHKSGIATMLIKLGEIAYNRGEVAAAQAQFEESLRLFRESGNKLGMSNALLVLGNAATDQGDYLLAQTLLERSLHLRRELGNRHGIATAFNNLAKVAALQGDFVAARTQFEESLRVHRELGNRRGAAYTLLNLGAEATMQGDYVVARSQLEEALSLCRELGNKLGIATALINLGDVDSGEGHLGAARTRLEEGLRLYRELDDKPGAAYTLSYLGRVVARQGNVAMARTLFEEGLRLCRELRDVRGIALALETMAGALSEETESAHVARLLGAAEALRKNISAPLPPVGQQQVDRLIAQVRTVLGSAAFLEAWKEGSTMTLEQAVGCAIKE